MKTTPHIGRRGRRPRERGYILIVFLLFLTLLVIAATAAAPSLVTQIRRDREQELIHRGTQYARAIRRFYKKFGRYPARLDELENTSNLRFLRRRYKDPMTPGGEWRIIHFGEAKVTPTGFGVQPAAPAGSAAAGPTSAAPTPATPSPSTGPGTPAAGLGTLQPGGPTFGGGPIVGVASTSELASIKELNGKNHYNDWEFVYDPRFDLSGQQAGVAGGPVTPLGGPAGPAKPGPQPPGAPGAVPQ